VDLQGKRLTWGSETKEGDRLNIAQIKQLTGGGDISARQLHGHQYTFTPMHKLLLMTNYKPHAEARDKAFWSRACLLEFGLRFVQEPRESNERQADLNLKEILQEERSGILAWLVRGCLEWQAQGLGVPASIQLSTSNYRDEEDRLHLFIQECCLVKPEASVKAGSLYQAYRTWFEENQFGGRSMNGKLFGDEMSKRFSKRITKRGRFYQGIGLLSPDPDDGQQSLFDNEVMGHNVGMNNADSASEAN
jgi:putative DNA primase/helicase